jgi:hypothetical protein
VTTGWGITESGVGGVGIGEQETASRVVKIPKTILNPKKGGERNIMLVIVPKAKSQSTAAIKLIQLFTPC